MMQGVNCITTAIKHIPPKSIADERTLIETYLHEARNNAQKSISIG